MILLLPARNTIRPIVVAIALICAFTSPVLRAKAQEPSRRVVVMQGGTRHVKGTIRGYNDVLYQVAAQPGVLRISLSALVGSNLFNVYAPGTQPGKAEAIFRGEIGGTKAELPITRAGDYLIQVFLMRNAARRGTTSRYTLSIELTK